MKPPGIKLAKIEVPMTGIDTELIKVAQLLVQVERLLWHTQDL